MGFFYGFLWFCFFDDSVMICFIFFLVFYDGFIRVFFGSGCFVCVYVFMYG